jgi:hypothetical protein
VKPISREQAVQLVVIDAEIARLFRTRDDYAQVLPASVIVRFDAAAVAAKDASWNAYDQLEGCMAELRMAAAPIIAFAVKAKREEHAADLAGFGRLNVLRIERPHATSAPRRGPSRAVRGTRRTQTRSTASKSEPEPSDPPPWAAAPRGSGEQHSRIDSPLSRCWQLGLVLNVEELETLAVLASTRAVWLGRGDVAA